MVHAFLAAPYRSFALLGLAMDCVWVVVVLFMWLFSDLFRTHAGKNGISEFGLFLGTVMILTTLTEAALMALATAVTLLNWI